MAPANDPVGNVSAMLLIAGAVLVIGWALWASARDRRKAGHPSLAFRIRARLTDWLWRLLRPRS